MSDRLETYQRYRSLYNAFLLRTDLMSAGDIVEFLGEPAVVVDVDGGRLEIQHVDGRVRRVEPVDVVNMTMMELLTVEMSS